MFNNLSISVQGVSPMVGMCAWRAFYVWFSHCLLLQDLVWLRYVWYYAGRRWLLSAVLPLWNYFFLLLPNTKHGSLLIYFTDSWRWPIITSLFSSVTDRPVASSKLKVNDHISKYYNMGLFFLFHGSQKMGLLFYLSDVATKLWSTKISGVSVRIIIMDATHLWQIDLF